MIYEIRIQNFKSIPNARLDFHLNPDGSPENKLDNEFKNLLVLVGQNGSGKSNLIDAIQFSLDVLTDDFEGAFENHGGFEAICFSKADTPNVIGFEIKLNVSNRDFIWGYKRENVWNAEAQFSEWCIISKKPLTQYSLLNVQSKIKPINIPDYVSHSFVMSSTSIEIGRHGEMEREFRHDDDNNSILFLFSPQNQKIKDLTNYIFSFSTYALFSNTLKVPQKTSKAKPMHRHGENWAAILKGMNKEQEGRELIAALGQLVGDIDDYRVIEAGGYLIPEFHHRGEGEGIWRGAGQESDGTVRLAGLLTALLQKPTPTLICLEEPELGVHPGSLRLLMDFVRQALHDTQVIITTHSPELIDLVPPECLRVVTREGGASKVSRLHPDQMEMLKKHLCTSSELWGMEGLLPTDEPDTVPEAVPDDAPAAPQDASAHDE